MTGSVVDAFMKKVTGVVRVGKDVGGRAVETAAPRIASGVEAVRTRLTGPQASPPTKPTPPADQERRAKAAGRRSSAPTPAEVAKNIAPHDPAKDPVIPARKPVKRDVPGAKLPAPRRAT